MDMRKPKIVPAINPIIYKPGYGSIPEIRLEGIRTAAFTASSMGLYITVAGGAMVKALLLYPLPFKM